jgi:predicted outer membrane repeat protein
MSDMTLENGGGRLGGIVHVRPGGKASFADCVFRKGAFAPLSSRVAKHPTTPKPPVVGLGEDGLLAKAYGGAVFVVNDDRLRTAEELAAARAAVAGTTAADSVTLGVAHNVTFARCSFLNNAAVRGDGGAVYARTKGLGWVIFDDCFFQSNRADGGFGGAVYASGGRVIFFETRFDGNVAHSGGAIYARAGGLIGKTVFSNNVAQIGSGGALFGADAQATPTEATAKSNVAAQAGAVRYSSFRGNNARVAGGAAFVVGGWRFWNNEHDLLPNTVVAESVVPHPEVYSCLSSVGGERVHGVHAGDGVRARTRVRAVRRAEPAAADLRATGDGRRGGDRRGDQRRERDRHARGLYHRRRGGRGGRNAEEGADGTATSEPPPPPPPGRRRRRDGVQTSIVIAARASERRRRFESYESRS